MATTALIGNSAAMTDVRRQMAAAIGAAVVLVRGERGTGKATVARTLLGDGPEIDCAAVDDAALAAVIATAPGPLLLREVGAAGPLAQATLLAVPPARRLAATTAHDLAALADDGGFDADLSARLATAAVDVPPLRDRADDVPDLCRHFAAIAARRERRPPLPPEPAAVDALRAHAWPRNVRELRNFVDRAYTVTGAGNPLRFEVVDPWLRAVAVDPVEATVGALAGQPLADIEKRVILTTLQQFRGHRIKTAGALGIGVRTLGIKLKRWRDEGDLVEPGGRVVG